MRLRPIIVAFVLVVGVSALYVGEQVWATLHTLTEVERERDRWQRPEDVVTSLGLHEGDVVVDLGSGAGYFALKLAPLVGRSGRVLAVDLRRESLAFLWIRAMLRHDWNIRVIHGAVDNPRLTATTVNAVLIANTYHELTASDAVLAAFRAAMRTGARLVVVDRTPRAGTDVPVQERSHHEMAADAAERAINRAGFDTVRRDLRFIDQPGDQDVWWLIVFRKP